MPYTDVRFVKVLTQYAEQSDEETTLIIPEDLSTLSDEELSELHTNAVSSFDAIYGDGKALTADDVTVLSEITSGIESLQAENAARAEAAAEREAAAAELASRVRQDEPTDTVNENDESVESEDEVQTEADAEDAPVDEDEGAAQSVAASGHKEIRVNLGNMRSRQRPPAEPADTPRSMRDVMLVADVPGFAAGTGLDWEGVGKAVDRRLAGFNQSQYSAAAQAGRHLREQLSVAVIRKPFQEGMTVQSSDPSHVDSVIRNAINEKRLPGGSLVASGGWCAPSETIYDLFEIESRDGLFSLPEIGVARGGINFTPGPDFSTIYAAAPGWNYTEAQDEAGTYDTDANGAGTGDPGTKPVYTVGCPSFTEKRLDLAGLAIGAGLLQQRGYPEMIARTVRGALVGHDHRMAGRVLAAVVTGSTAVTMTTDQVGTTAPLLEGIELQVEHYRYIHRLARGTTLEAVFPYWVRGAIRADLSRRTGVELLGVTDGQIDGWFSQRGISPQFVYNWQDITGAAGNFKTWPSTVKFLLYAAGTWVKGGSDVITLDTIYDSVLLGTNDYTALFTEEGWLVAKLGHDSRVVTLPISSSGGANIGVVIDSDGTEVVAP